MRNSRTFADTRSESSTQQAVSSLYQTILEMDPSELASFRRRLRCRYSQDDLIEELRASAQRLGHSPTMREFAGDSEAGVHPQTIVERFGSWNGAKRAAGLMPRRMATRDELSSALALLGKRLGRVPTAKDIEAAGSDVPGKSVYIKTFGSVRAALCAAGFDVPQRSERMARSIEHGVRHFQRTGCLPSFRDWERLRGNRDDLMTAWQIYRAYERDGGAWSAFQKAICAASQADERVPR